MAEDNLTSIDHPVPEVLPHKTVATEGAIFGVSEIKSFGAAAGVVIDIVCDEENSAN